MQIERLNKVFSVGKDLLNALQDINMTVEPSEFAVIVGPSGCGKTTLLRIVAGLEKPTSGKITLNGHPIDGPGPDRGVVFQNYSLFPWLTVEDNVAFGPRQSGKSPAQVREIVDHYLNVTGLTPFRNLYPKALSGGMKQRTAIARALANEPDILLMDEPFGALDAQTRVVMQELLLKVWEVEHKTVLFITHDIDEAIFLADTIHVMTSHPGTIKKTIHVSLDRPRNHEIMLTPEFMALKKEIVDMIWEESIQAAVAVQQQGGSLKMRV